MHFPNDASAGLEGAMHLLWRSKATVLRLDDTQSRGLTCTQPQDDEIMQINFATYLYQEIKMFSSYRTALTPKVRSLGKTESAPGPVRDWPPSSPRRQLSATEMLLQL